MKKSLTLFLIMLLCIICFCALGTGCGGDEKQSDDIPPTNTQEPAPSDPSLLSFTDVSFQNAEYVYDGNEKTITVVGNLPTGTTIDYTQNKATDAGSYNAKAVLKCIGYNDLTLTAKLTISKATITGLTLSNETVEYDALTHSLQIIGNAPVGATVEYTYNGQKTDGVSAVNSYSVIAKVSCKNYNDLTLSATLTIKSTEKQLFSAAVGNTVYFQNDLDGDKLYSVSQNGTLKKINNDVPNYMIEYGGNLYYISTGLLSAKIRKYDGSTATDLYKVAASAKFLTTDGTYLYYSVGLPLISRNSDGIYRVSLADTSEEEKVVSDKAEYIVCYGGKLYYSNVNDGKRLYSVSATANNGTGTKLNDYRTQYIIEENGYLYYNATNSASGITGDIFKYKISDNTETKLTNVAGKSFAKINSFIYYLNNDILSSTLFGDGIYRVNALVGNNVGTKVLSAENDGFSSLTGDGNYLYYYRLNDKHLYRYNESTQTETDLMADFVPVDDTSLSGYSVLAEHNGEIYFTNPHDESCLYKYNTTTRSVFKVLAEHTANVYFYGDYMYYSSYVLTNYAFYRTNMQTGETEKIYTGRAENIIFDGNSVYFVKIGVAQTYTNYIMKMDIDGSNVQELYKGKNLNISGFAKAGEKIYFVINPSIGYKYIYVYDIAAATAQSLDIKAANLVIANNKIYYYAHTENALKTCDLNGNSIATLKSSVEINDIYADGETIYFSSTSSANTGLFKVNSNGTVLKITDTPAHGFVVANGNLFFLQSDVSYTNDYPSQNSSYNGRLYSYDGTTVKQAA